MTLEAPASPTRQGKRFTRRSRRAGHGLVALAGIAALAAASAGLPGASAAGGLVAQAGSQGPPDTSACYVTVPVVTGCAFFSQGKLQSFHVPWWAENVIVEAAGATGAPGVGAMAGSGGLGATAYSDLTVTAGSSLVVRVGGTPLPGSGAGGWNGGGVSYGGGGGGASDVRTGAGRPQDRILVAGGGGGGGTRGWRVPDPGTPGNGGPAQRFGSQGQNGSNSPFTAGGGYGGTITGGAGGSGSSGMAFYCGFFRPFAFAVNGTAGASSQAGQGGFLQSAGAPCPDAGGFGGGGGGGYESGGGGGGGVNAGAGGGGGSSFGPPGATFGSNSASGGRAYVLFQVSANPGWTSTELSSPIVRTPYAAPISAARRPLESGGETIDVFSLDERGEAVHWDWKPGSTPTMTSTSSLRGVVFQAGSTLAAVSSGPERLDLVGRASNGGLFHNVWDGVHWSGWTRLTADGTSTSSPAIASWGPGRLDVFVRDQRGELKHGWSDNGGSTWGWETFAGQVKGDPSAVSWGPGRIDLFADVPDDSSSPLAYLQHQWWDGSSWSGWKPWSDPDAPAMSTTPTVSSGGPGQLDIWIRDSSGRVARRQFANHGWTGWVDVGEIPSSRGEPVAAVALDGGDREMLARGELDNVVWHKRLP